MERPVGRSTPAGFTLVEMLVATAILSVLALGAMLSVSGRTGPTDAARLERLFETQAALAVAERSRRGLYLTPTGAQVARWRDGRWERAGRAIRWTRRASVLRRDPGPPGAPQLVFLGNGRASAVSVRFEDAGICQSDGWTGLICSEG